MKKWLVVLVLLAGCGGSPEPEAKPGDPDVYQRIEAETDCDKLQVEFDQAMANVERYPAGSPERKAPLAYAEAAETRRQALNC